MAEAVGRLLTFAFGRRLSDTGPFWKEWIKNRGPRSGTLKRPVGKER